MDSVLELLQQAHALQSLSVSAPTSITTPGVFVEIAGTLVISPQAEFFSQVTGNQLKYDGEDRVAVIGMAGLQVASGLPNTVVNVAFALNGVVITDSILGRKVGTGSDSAAISIFHDTLTDTGDHYTIFTTADKITTVTIEALTHIESAVQDIGPFV
jgi:hypothetical protein